MRFFRRLFGNGSVEAVTVAPTKPVPSAREIDVHLAEYNSLRTEIINRMNIQSQAFNYLMIVIGAAATAVLTGLDSSRSEYLPHIVMLVAFVLPLLCAPLGFIFFDNEMAIHAIGSYIEITWKPRAIGCLGDEAEIVGSIWHFVGLPKGSAELHRRLSQGRWVLFLLPTVVPVVALLLLALSQTFDALGSVIPLAAEAPDLYGYTEFVAWVAFVVDASLAVLLMRGVAWALTCPR